MLNLTPSSSGFWGGFLGQGMGGSMPPEDQERWRRSIFGVALAVILLFGLLFLRLWHLQLVEGESLQRRSEFNRIRLQDLAPWRGMILDRKGEVLVANRPSYELVVILEDVQDAEQLASRLKSLLGLDDRHLVEQLTQARQSGQRMVRLRADLSWDEMALVETFRPELPGVSIQIQPKREYRQKGMACHALGYLGEITEAQIKSGRFPHYKMGDAIGKCGIEWAWEGYLGGRRGFRRIEVDAFGRELRQLNQERPSPGANVYLTLDTALQREAEECLKDKVGAIVALDPRNGKILAMASSPTFNQEDFERGLTAKEWQALRNNQNHPLENRVLKGQYPPGSTFKIVMAVAGLEEKVITPKSIIFCSGSLPFGNHVFHCWRKGGHGGVDLYRALVQSCDIYFYTVGRRLGIERVAKWARQFGLGQPTDLKLDKEMPGLVASSAWKLERYRDPWREGDTLSVAIGQGYNLTTPIQMAQVVAAIANGGQVFEPQLVERIESPAGEILYQALPKLKSRLAASKATLDLVKKALHGVVAEGTGKNAKLPQVEVGGKTGTSQVVSLEKEKGAKKARYQNHAWFVAFAPVADPQIAVAVVVEHGGGGGAVAAPLAKRLLAVAFPTPKLAQSEPGSR
jgi:penicillin-binding protein 2